MINKFTNFWARNWVFSLYFFGIVVLLSEQIGIINQPSTFHRYGVLLLILSVLVIESVVTQRYTKLRILGNYKNSIKYNLILLLIVINLVAFLLTTNLYTPGMFSSDGRGWGSWTFLIFYILIGVPAQQLLVWGDFRSRIIEVFPNSKLAWVILPAILYSVMHIYYVNPWSILFGTFGLGLIWGCIVNRTGSILGNILSHWLIGLIGFGIRFV